MNIKTFINDLKQASLVVDYVKQATTIEGYATAIKGLTLEQAKLALSTRNLSVEQQKEILLNAGLIEETGRLTVAQATETLATRTGSVADAKAILLKSGLVAENTAESNAILTVDAAKLKELVDTNKLTLAEAELLAAKAGVTLQSKKETNALIKDNYNLNNSFSILGKNAGNALKSIGKGMLSFASAHPVISALVSIIGLVGILTVEYKKLQEEQKEAIETAKALQDEYRNFIQSSSDNIKSLQNQIKEFEELSKGVTKYGENISLSADEYDRYKSIVSEILGYTPDLISGYNKEGEAIADKNSLIERSIELLKEEQRQKLKEMTSDEKTSDAYKGAKAEWDKSNAGYEGAYIRNDIARWFENNSTSNGWRYGYDIAKILGISEDYSDNNYRLSSAIIDNIDIVAENIKAKKSELLALEDAKGVALFTEEEIDTMIESANDWQQAYSEWLQEIEDSKHGMDDQFALYSQRAKEYDSLTDAQKAFVNEYIKATGDITNANGHLLSEDEILDKAKDYEKFVNKLATDPNFEVARNKINELFSLDKTSVSAGEYEQQVNLILAELQNSFDLTDDEVKDLKVSLGFTFLYDGKTQVSELLENVQNFLQDEFDSNVNSLTLGDLQIASNLDIPPNTQLTWEELLARIEEVKSATHEVTLNDLIAESKELQNSFDDTFSKQSTIQSVLDKIREGTSLSADEVLELVEVCGDKFPEISTMFEKTADGWTIAADDLINANDAIIESMRDMIQDLIDGYKKVIEEYENRQIVIPTPNVDWTTGGIPTTVVQPEFNTDITQAEYETAVNGLAEANLWMEMFGVTTDKTASELGKFNEMVDDVSSKTNLISTAIDEMNEEGSISASTYAEIIAKGEDYADCIDLVDGKLVLNIQALKDLEAQEYKNAISANELTLAQMALGISSHFDYQEFLEKKKALEEENTFYQQLIDEIYGAYGGGDTDTSDQIKAAFDADMQMVEHWHTTGLVSEKEYLDVLEKANEEHYKNSAEHYDDYLANIEKIYNGRKDLFKNAVDEQIKALDEQLEKGFINPSQYQSEMTKLMEQSYGMGSKYYGTEFATENYNEMSDMIEDKDVDVYESKLEELKKANDGSIETERQFIEKWKSLNKTMFEDADPKKYKENLEEIAEYEEDWNIRRAENEKTYWENLKQEVEDYYDKEIEKLQSILDEEEKINKQEELRNNLIKARQDLENAKKNRNQLVFANGSFEYTVDQEAVEQAAEAEKDAQRELERFEIEQDIKELDEQRNEKLDAIDAVLEKVDNHIKGLNGEIDPTSSDTEVISNAGATNEAQQAQEGADSVLNKDDSANNTDTSQEIKVETSKPVVVENDSNKTEVKTESGNTNVETTQETQLSTEDIGTHISNSVDQILANFNSLLSDENRAYYSKQNGELQLQRAETSPAYAQSVYNNSTVNNDNSQTIVVQQANFNLDKGSGEEVIYQAFNNLKNRFASYDDRRRGK